MGHYYQKKGRADPTSMLNTVNINVTLEGGYRERKKRVGKTWIAIINRGIESYEAKLEINKVEHNENNNDN